MKFRWNMDTMGLIAKKQKGKSTMIKKILKNISKNNIIILDSNREYGDFPHRWIPKNYNRDEMDEFLRYVRKHVNKLVVIEDIDLFFETPTDEFRKFLINCSHQNIGVMYTSKRPKRIPQLLLSETTHFLVGQLAIESDAEHLSFIFNDTSKIKNIKPFEFLYKDTNTGEEKIMKS